MRKRGFDLLVFLLAIVFVSISISALDLEFTVQDSACDSAERTVMGLSSTTNAHGEEWNQGNYGSFLCSTDPGTHICDPGMENKVIGLSGNTNAHGEIPTNTNYASNVCFGSLRCVSITELTCPNNYALEMVSLSGGSNAHIGDFGNYDIKICCADILTPYSYWISKDETSIETFPSDVIPGVTKVGLVFKNSGLNTGGTMIFQVEKKTGGIWWDFTDLFNDPLFSDPSVAGSDEARKFWTIPQDIGGSGDDITLRFKGTHPISGDVIVSSELAMHLSADPDRCKDPVVIGQCLQYTDAGDCAGDPCNVVEDNLGGLVDCTLDTIDCFCSFNTPDCEATFTSSTITDEIKTIGETCTIEITDPDINGCEDGDITFKYEKICDGVLQDEGISSYACPAEVQLPFFGFYNFIATMLVIALMYYFMFSYHIKKENNF